ncbi:MAG TPA: hypothetical protein VGG10_02215 [Rhizomicrobium sp.]|jgi:hypothetical protein
MSDFDYLSVLISIVLGLGITNILTAFAGLVRSRSRITMFWPTPLTLVTLFVIHVQTWWALFGLRDIRHWTIAGFFMVLMQPVLLFLASAMLVPDFSGDRPINLHDDFYRERGWFYASLLGLLTVSFLRPVVLIHHLSDPIDVGAHLLFIAMMLFGLLVGREIVQKFVAAFMFVFIIAYVAVLFVNLPR